MRILVTGGAGYIGSICSAALVESGHSVDVLDDLSTGHADAVHPGARLVVAPVAHAAEVLDEHDAVIHFAARSQVAESTRDPELYWRNNVAQSIDLVVAARRAEVGRLVFSSSAAVYGAPRTAVIDESHPTAPINPYGATKLAIDNLLAGESAAYGMRTVSLRYFNVGGSSGGRGERHDPETHLVPRILTAAIDGMSAQIYGDDYDTPDGTCIRDYLHVEDLVTAHLAALDRSLPGHSVINLGTGVGYSVREVIAAARAVTGMPLPEIVEARRPGDPSALVASYEHAERTLGWRPRHGLDRVVEDAWQFLRSR